MPTGTSPSTARRRAGACHHGDRRITLSAPLTRLYDEPTVREVVLHEVAHALVGPMHVHDALWRAKARQVGASPRASLDRGLPSPEGDWAGTCPRCGAVKHLFRSPQRVVSCGSCSRVFDPAVVLEWTYRGHPREPGRRYRREARLLRQAGLMH
ncbi:SprT-like domain-containing protein [Schaalia sp. 19OD2882]|uniref:SprT-like domain-containing protein n=1 Tax=Schaalia sp. 19OD2882 TaxID=2794089 RepID=UPI003467AC6A